MTPTATRRRARAVDHHRSDALAYGLLLPAGTLMLVILILPALFNVVATFFSWRLFGSEPQFIGFENWVRILDERWLATLGRTAVFVVGTVTLQVVLGFGIAYLLYKHLGRLGRLASVVFLLPMMISEVAGGLLWRYILTGAEGPLNTALGAIGIPPQQWLGPELAMLTVIAVDVWMNVPFTVLVMFAAMQSMPAQVLEAADVDGATGLWKLRSVLIPLLQPAILVVLMFRTIFALRAFATIFTLTGGGPGDRTAIIGVEVYQLGFSNYNVGLSATLAIVLLLVSFAVGLGYIRWLSRESLS